MNPAMLDIFNKQKINKIIVGDPNQQIYMFRGAINALGSVEASSVYHLTQSFRFGPRIGYLANTCLEILQKVKTQTLVGGKKRDKIINRDEIKDVRDYKPIAVIGRTNIGLFQELAKIVCATTNPPKFAMLGGIEKYDYKDLIDIYHCYHKRPEKMVNYKEFD